MTTSQRKSSVKKATFVEEPDAWAGLKRTTENKTMYIGRSGEFVMNICHAIVMADEQLYRQSVIDMHRVSQVASD